MEAVKKLFTYMIMGLLDANVLGPEKLIKIYFHEISSKSKKNKETNIQSNHCTSSVYDDKLALDAPVQNEGS